MAATVASLISDVKTYNPALGSGDDTAILLWINAEKRKMQNRRGIRSGRHHLQQADDDLVADQDVYAWPSDFIRIHLLMIKNSENKYVPAKQADLAEIRQWDADGKSYAAGEYWFALFDTANFMLRGDWPDGQPDTTTVGDTGMRIDYFYDPAALLSGGSVSSIFERHRDVLVLGAARRSGVRERDNWGELLLLYREAWADFVRDINDRASGPNRMLDARALGGISGRRRGFGRIS